MMIFAIIVFSSQFTDSILIFIHFRKYVSLLSYSGTLYYL